MYPHFQDAELENWHDFEVESRREIIALLRGIGEKNQLIRMLIKGEADVCVTSILDVDEAAQAVYLDCSIDQDQNRRVLASRQLSFETTLDKVRILFAAENVEATTYEGNPAFKIAIPATLIRLQRREFYRIGTPVSNPVRVLIALPAELGGPTSFPLADISCGGISILDNKMILGNAVGKEYPDCRIDLPEVGAVATALQVRNSLDLTLLNNKSNRRLGCEFRNISRGALATVQRYITKLERERNARIAGLS
ncbi:flagellar brake protein [Duganella dendranthematis]|jgi:c-di-GMP-binding flagellar brake protein YcgR|uniref:Flagellar brake protein YcgR n=1 Tax=Duganella dendranthematis TaxID=2728021 RepID=A0ABX6M512_9BURK|nr:flagellar brake protein [Duganella dendranthematis]QJD89378.1 flagellar brake protein [Duganella dendranthematis]